MMKKAFSFSCYSGRFITNLHHRLFKLPNHRSISFHLPYRILNENKVVWLNRCKFSSLNNVSRLGGMCLKSLLGHWNHLNSTDKISFIFKFFDYFSLDAVSRERLARLSESLNINAVNNHDDYIILRDSANLLHKLSKMVDAPLRSFMLSHGVKTRNRNVTRLDSEKYIVHAVHVFEGIAYDRLLQALMGKFSTLNPRSIGALTSGIINLFNSNSISRQNRKKLIFALRQCFKNYKPVSAVLMLSDLRLLNSIVMVSSHSGLHWNELPQSTKQFIFDLLAIAVETDGNQTQKFRVAIEILKLLGLLTEMSLDIKSLSDQSSILFKCIRFICSDYSSDSNAVDSFHDLFGPESNRTLRIISSMSLNWALLPLDLKADIENLAHSVINTYISSQSIASPNPANDFEIARSISAIASIGVPLPLPLLRQYVDCFVILMNNSISLKNSSLGESKPLHWSVLQSISVILRNSLPAYPSDSSEKGPHAKSTLDLISELDIAVYAIRPLIADYVTFIAFPSLRYIQEVTFLLKDLANYGFHLADHHLAISSCETSILRLLQEKSFSSHVVEIALEAMTLHRVSGVRFSDEFWSIVVGAVGRTYANRPIRFENHVFDSSPMGKASLMRYCSLLDILGAPKAFICKLT